METKPLDVYSEASNFGVVRMPGRRFPGSVIQGDSLSILVSMAEVIHRESTTIKNRALAETARELHDLLRERLGHYEAVLSEHDMELPYVKQPRA